MPFHKLAFRAAALVALAAPIPTRAQSTSSSGGGSSLRIAAPITTLGGVVEDRARVAQLLDSTRSTAGFLLRSPSSLTPRLNPAGLAVGLNPPTVMVVNNSAVPYSGNDGPLWAGRGANVYAMAGLRVEWGRRFRLVVAPELSYAANEHYEAFDLAERSASVPNRYANPWYLSPNSIDLPLRFGDERLQRVDPGQSSLVVQLGSAEVGAATENEWWGPGIRNALILSNNAPGFPHAFVRTAAPLQTRFGAFEGRWLVGGLEESDYFDATPGEGLRSISMLALTWQIPWWQRGLTLGAARAVYAPADGWGSVPGDFAQVFSNVPAYDGVRREGKDQLFSLFMRWVFPNDGFETYAEWARADQPLSLRDFLLAPNHSQAYTLGLQWAGPEVAPWGRARGRVRIGAEVSFLEQSTTFRFRPIGTWYTSPRVPQGYTNHGQTLGAAIGPGSSSQFVRVDYLASRWQAGLFVERLRLFEDAHSLDPESNFCNHDVSLLPGIAGAVRTPVGTLSASYSSGWRLNTHFVLRPGNACAEWDGLDVRSNTLRVSFTPLTW